MTMNQIADHTLPNFFIGDGRHHIRVERYVEPRNDLRTIHIAQDPASIEWINKYAGAAVNSIEWHTYNYVA